MALPRTSFSRRPLLALIVLILLLVIGYTSRVIHDHSAKPTTPATLSTSQYVALSSLPAQAIQTIGLIQQHGPFPYTQDGTVYQNLGHQLPREKAGYYHEYTVPTPGSDDRGARRIITGSTGEFFYTADHYATFRQVALGR